MQMSAAISGTVGILLAIALAVVGRAATGSDLAESCSLWDWGHGVWLHTTPSLPHAADLRRPAAVLRDSLL